MKRILVTGADGQLGRELRRVVGTPTADAGVATRRDKVEKGGAADGGCKCGEAVGSAGGLEWIFTDVAELDITNQGAVDAFFGQTAPDVVVNCAAFTDVDRAEREREAAFRVNRDAVRWLAEASARTGAALIHVSTDFVFNGASQIPYTENNTPSPINVYGESKLAGEVAVKDAGCRGAVIRTSWLYSPWGRNFVKSIMAAAASRDELTVVDDQLGCPTAAEGLAEAIVGMIPTFLAGADAGSGAGSSTGSGRAETYHYCDAGVVSRADFAREIIRQARLKCSVKGIATADYEADLSATAAGSAIRVTAARPLYSALDTAKIGRDFGIEPRPWQERLAECLFRLKNEEKK